MPAEGSSTRHDVAVIGDSGDSKDGLVREMRVREFSMRETTTREYDAAALRIHELELENAELKKWVERIQIDTDTAIRKGHDRVCWQV